MRPIEYRAWHLAEQKMYIVGSIEFENATHEIIYIKLLDPVNQTAFSTDEIYQVEFMQYTGLLDKNGKKIFEGDIVKTDDNMIIQVLSIAELIQTALEYVLMPDYRDGEVVSNIYQHPSLLDAIEKPDSAK